MSISIENSIESLSGKVVLLTGAGRGIGKAMALGFLSQGARVFGIARSTEELSTLQGETREAAFAYCSADLADPNAPADAVKQALDIFGTLDILVNNAGVGSGENPRPVSDFDDHFWNYTL